MRLDYALYGLAVVLFVLTGITFALVAETDVRNVYAISTALVGIISLGGGYFLRPKATKVSADETANPPPPVLATVPAQQTALVVEASKIEAPLAEAPKVEALIKEQSPIQAAIVAEAPKVEAVEPKVSAEEPIVAESVTPATEVVSGEPKEAATQASPSAKLEFAEIRSISEKRAEQLKANGISTLRELANADALELAAKLNISPKIVKMWIGSAKKLAK